MHSCSRTVSQRASLPGSHPRSTSSILRTSAVKKRHDKNVVCSKTMTALPEKREQVAKLLAEMVTYSEQRSADSSSGIVRFQCVRDSWEPDTFHCYERYTTNAAMGKHNMDPVMLQFMESKILPNLQGPMGWAMYEYKDGKLGYCCMPEGPKGEGGLDDATGETRTAGGASMRRTSAATPAIRALMKEEEMAEEEEEKEKQEAKAKQANLPAEDMVGAMKKQLQQLGKNLFAFNKPRKS